MARPLRVQYPGAVYHVMSRGNAGKDIFLSSSDRLLFLDTLSEVCKQSGWRVHAYALMNNHYHLLLETPAPNLVDGMKWFQGTYTQRFNLRHQRAGHLYQGRYKSLPVDSADASYFRKVGTYIHLNPIRAGVVNDEPELFQDGLLSSYPHYVDDSFRPCWLEVSRLLSYCGIPADNAEGRGEYRRYMANRISDTQSGIGDAETDQLRRAGWCHGSDEFKKELSQVLEGTPLRSKDGLHGDQRVHHGIERAENLLNAAILMLGITQDELLKRKAVDIEKQAVIWLLKQHTTVTVSWIANRLSARHRVNASRAIKRFRDAADNSAVMALKQKMLQCLG